MNEKNIKEIELDDILPNRFQPRIKFNQEALTELANSIKEHGVIQPVIVREIGNKYEIIAGERRYKASVLAGKTTIPAIVHNVDDARSSELALIENIQRQDLTPIEEAASYKRILELGNLTQQQLAAKIDKNQATISNKLRLLNLTDQAQEALLNEEVSERHARSLLKVESEVTQNEMLKRIINERLTVRQTDVEIDKLLGTKEDEGENIMEETIEEIIIEDLEEEVIAEPIKEEKFEEAPGYLDIDQIENEAQDIYVEPEAKDWGKILKEEEDIEAEMKENFKGKGIDLEFSNNLQEEMPKIEVTEAEPIEEKATEEESPIGRFFNFATIDDEENKERLPQKEPNVGFELQPEEKITENKTEQAKEKISKLIEEMKASGVSIEVDESDLGNLHQFIIKIKKD